MVTLAFRTAFQEVTNLRREYESITSSNVSDQLLRDHSQAIEARDCENFLKLAIEAFHWLEEARADIREDILAGRLIYDRQGEASITELYEKLVAVCTGVENWVQTQLARGHALENLQQFRACRAEAEDILETRQLHHLAENARQAIAEEA